LPKKQLPERSSQIELDTAARKGGLFFGRIQKTGLKIQNKVGLNHLEENSMKLTTLAMGLLGAGMVFGFARLANAQMVGLPVMDTASPRDRGNLEVTPGAMFGHEMDSYGARTTISALDDLRVFVDLGAVDMRDEPVNFAIQGGALYTLDPIDLADLAIRGVIYHTSAEYLALTGVNGMLIFSDETLLDHLYLYGGAGLDVVYKSFDNIGGANDSKMEVNPALALGLSFQCNNRCSLFVEADYIDGLYAGGGISIR